VLLAYALFCDGRLDEARSAIARARTLDPDSPVALATSAMLSAWSGAHQAALKDAGRALALAPAVPIVTSIAADAYARAGQCDQARAILTAAASQREPVGAALMAAPALASGSEDLALTWLERARDARCSWLPTMRVDPRLAALHGHPGYAAIFDAIPTLDIPESRPCTS
jgi:predicted Zn-dependent protease